MSREQPCGREEARLRARVAELYLRVAELAQGEPADEAPSVAAGCAVLAAVAASDAICCMRLGRRNRGPDHFNATSLLEAVDVRLARDLATVLAEKDLSHYGLGFVSPIRARRVLRCARKLVDAAAGMVAGR